MRMTVLVDPKNVALPCPASVFHFLDDVVDARFVYWTSLLVTRCSQRILGIRRRHLPSKPLSRPSSFLLVLQVSAAYSRTDRTFDLKIFSLVFVCSNYDFHMLRSL